VDQAPAARVARDQADRADRVGLVIRVTPGDMSRVAGTADTGRAAMTRVDPADTAGRADPVAMTPVDRADPASREDTTLADPTTLGGMIPGDPEVTTRVSLADMTRERPQVQSRAAPASPGDTTPVDRALLGRTPMRPPLTAEPRLRMPALLLLTPADRRARVEATPVERRCRMEEATRQEALIRAAAVRPADRTPRLEAIRLVGGDSSS
jgi:hypothetical protein